MSWRRYVFLHRIHPQSILIGSSLFCWRKEKEQRWEEEWIKQGWRVEKESETLPRVSVFTFPAMPSHLCGLNNEVRCWSVFVLSFIEQLPDDRNLSHSNTMTMLTLKPSPSDWQMLPSHGQPRYSLGEQDRECMQRGCVFVHVCEMYVDGLCEGLEGKCSRLLSLRSCQSRVDRNQKKRARAPGNARMHCSIHTEVVRSRQGGGAARSHTAPRWLLVGTAVVVLVADADFGSGGLVRRFKKFERLE